MSSGERVGGALSIPAFRRVWIGATVSAAGDAASWVALVALALGRATSGEGSVALLAVLYTAPVAVGGLAAGWALDRFDRRQVMIIDSVIRGLVFAAIPLALAVGSLPRPLLYAVASVYGLFKMIGLAGFPSLIPALVPDEQFDQANALEGAAYGLASLTGAGLAGLAVATVGPGWVIAFDAASYAVMALSLWSVSTPATAHPTDGSDRPGGSSLAAIVRLAVADPVLRDTTIMFALFNIGGGALLVFLPHRAIGLGLGAGGYGYLVAATTGGELLGALALTRLTWRRPPGSSIAIAQLIAGLIVALLILPTAAVALVALAALGVCSAPMTAWAQSLRMRRVAPAMHGRLFAVLRTTMQATPPLGALLAAGVTRFGSTPTVLIIAAVMAMPAVVLGPHLASRADHGTASQDVSSPGIAAG